MKKLLLLVCTAVFFTACTVENVDDGNTQTEAGTAENFKETEEVWDNFQSSTKDEEVDREDDDN